MENINNINSFFSETLRNLKCDKDTKAYIISIFTKFKDVKEDYSKDSITLIYSQAKYRQDFYIFQSLGDWLFMTKSMFPSYFNKHSGEYYTSLARLSYYNCYRIIREWKIYEALADQFIELTDQSKKLLIK